MSINVKRNGELTKIAGLYQTTAPVGMADCYSTEEKIVGCWTDGKPIYECVYDFNSISLQPSPWYETSIDSSNIDTLVNGVAYNKTWTLGCVCVFKNNSKINVVNLGSSQLSTNRLILKYTKTTDTPGSGQWTPSGAPAVHYSSQEHIIGTYEGETLYERTITHEGQLSSGFNSFLTVNDIKAMIGCELSVRNSSNNSWHNCSSSSSSSSMEVQIQIDANNVGSFGVITSTTWNNPVVIATYRYTKTTD